MKRCEHGIYIAEVDVASGKSWGCDLCWPQGRPATQSPVLPRSSADTLGRSDARENCVKCQNLRTFFSPVCLHCGETFPERELRGNFNTTANAANRHQTGSCPQCGSAVHYETKKSTKWECADCGVMYSAPSWFKNLPDEQRHEGVKDELE